MSSRVFPTLLVLVLVAGMCLAWSPGYWAVFVAQAGILLVAILWVATQKRIHPSREWMVAALISFWGLLQIAAGQTISSWWTMRSSLTWISAGMSFLVASQALRRHRYRELFLSGLLWSSTALAFLAIVQMYVDPRHVFGMFPAQPGSVGTFLYKNQFAALLEIALPLALHQARYSRKTRYGAFAACAILLAAGVASVSRAGVILLVAELVLALLLAFRPKGLVFASLILALGATIGGPKALWDHFRDQEPYRVRHDLLQSTMRMAGDRPWFGYGMGTFPLAYPAYARFDAGVFVNAAHSDWAEWSAEGGFPLAVLLVVLLTMLSGRAVRSIWGIGVLAVALHSLVDYPAREPTIALTWFAIMGALTAATESKARAADWEVRPARRLQNYVPAAPLPRPDRIVTG
jgi:O-antigen ligase